MLKMCVARPCYSASCSNMSDLSSGWSLIVVRSESCCLERRVAKVTFVVVVRSRRPLLVQVLPISSSDVGFRRPLRRAFLDGCLFVEIGVTLSNRSDDDVAGEKPRR
jgi:hypothetical protein